MRIFLILAAIILVGCTATKEYEPTVEAEILFAHNMGWSMTEVEARLIGSVITHHLILMNWEVQAGDTITITGKEFVEAEERFYSGPREMRIYEELKP